MKIGVPSGIGDISWLISKLVNSEQWKANNIEIIIADGWPWRAQPYIEMLGVKSSYGSFRFEDIVAFEKMHNYCYPLIPTWKEILSKGFDNYLMQPNWHLESGRKLATYLPDLDTSYHYELKTPDISAKKFNGERVSERLSSGNWVGISCASYRGSTAWKTWGYEEWYELCRLLIATDHKICFLGGAWDDLTEMVCDEIKAEDRINLVGKTSFPEACAIHKLLPFYIGFSSGLGIIRTVLNLPTLMLWPYNEHINQQALSTSWSDPSDVESRKYIARTYMAPRLIFSTFRTQEEIWKREEEK